MNHWALFKRSASILWRYKTLWVFGLLAALGGGFNLNWQVRDVRPMTDLPFGARELLRSLFSSSDFTALIGLGLALGVLAFLVSTFGQAALISMVNAIEAGQSVSVGAGTRAASSRFAPLLVVRFVLALPLLILGLLAAGSFFTAFSGWFDDAAAPRSIGLGALGAFTVLGGLSFIVGLLTSAVGIGAERAVVLENLPIGPALAHGWRLLWSRFADYFAIALIFLVLAIVVGIALACAFIPIFVATLIPNLAQLQSSPDIFLFVTNSAGPALIIVLVIGLIIGSLVAVFTSSVWTLAYRRWQAALPVTPTAST
ncbi:MAG TPA: hypothetical protein VJG32_18775 [Anaerolineae bacterium]|nr:hypothetical protein [Anaerolineae bacterium]